MKCTENGKQMCSGEDSGIIIQYPERYLTPKEKCVKFGTSNHLAPENS